MLVLHGISPSLTSSHVSESVPYSAHFLIFIFLVEQPCMIDYLASKLFSTLNKNTRRVPVGGQRQQHHIGGIDTDITDVLRPL